MLEEVQKAMFAERSITWDNGLSLTLEDIKGMTEFPSFYELFERLGREKDIPPEKRAKCLGKLVHEFEPGYTFYVTEKMDGTNIGLIFYKKKEQLHLIIRGRTELLGHSSDYLYKNPYEVISYVKDMLLDRKKTKLLEVLETSDWFEEGELFCVYTEFIGPKIQKRGKSYGEKRLQVFAIRRFTEEVIKTFQATPREKWTSIRRINAVVPFLAMPEVIKFCEQCNIEHVTVLRTCTFSEVNTPEKIIALLDQNSKSSIGKAEAEGLVLWAETPRDFAVEEEGKIERKEVKAAIFKLKKKDY